MGTKFEGNCFFRGIDFMGIVCLGGQEVGDRKPGDQMGSGPNELQPVYMGHSDVLSFIVLCLVL